jgi:2-oxoisovalerate dehydrogenase E1 component
MTTTQPTVRPATPGLAASRVDWRAVARLMLISRAIDHIEETELTPSGKVAYQFSSRGHDLAQILLALALDHPHDAAAVYYRSRPFTLACGMTIEEAFAGPLGRAGSLNGGRDIGVVHMLPPRGRATVLPASGDVGAQYTPAVGWAQAVLYRQRVLGEKEWAGAIAVALGGDGSVAANGFWAALNIVTTLSLPYLFVIEDNGFGISVPGVLQTPGANIAENLASFKNLSILDGDGANPVDASEKIAQAVASARAGQPTLLRLSVPRLSGHSFVDNQAYKSPELRREEEARDPLPRLRDFVTSHHIMSGGDWTALERSVEAEVSAARDAALAQPEPDPATAHRYVFFEDDRPPTVGGLRAEGVPSVPSTSSSRGFQGAQGTQGTQGGVRLNFIDAVKRTLESELKVNPRVLIFGEDVGVKGGVHGATTDLQSHFGAERVFDTSLSEEGIIGRAVGLAFAGLMPVPEIQFRKYADPATEQINDCGTIRWRTKGQFAAPIVVRVPVGFGRKTGDPWHSVSGEAIFAHTVGWRIAYPSNAEDAVGLLRAALRGDDPTFFFEHRALLDTAPARRPYPGDDYVLPFGVASVVQAGDELTVVTWGEMVHRCQEAGRDYRGRLEIIDLRTIVPWDKAAVLNSVRKTSKVLIVHEDTWTAGFGAEVVATIAQEAFMDLDGPVVRLATSDNPIPYNPKLMDAVVPTVEKIRREVERLLAF